MTLRISFYHPLGFPHVASGGTSAEAAYQRVQDGVSQLLTRYASVVNRQAFGNFLFTLIRHGKGQHIVEDMPQILHGIGLAGACASGPQAAFEILPASSSGAHALTLPAVPLAGRGRPRTNRLECVAETRRRPASQPPLPVNSPKPPPRSSSDGACLLCRGDHRLPACPVAEKVGVCFVPEL